MNKDFTKNILDGLYADFDGYQICLAANDRVSGNPTDKVYLEPSVIEAFLRYVWRLKKEAEDERS